ncbi:MAG TPA: copper chaperone PCu(A)C [Aromatoleum sp.]|uniref:copper chaperone PCu(A)C n=1 Tax=Aromatoleum sp. TaxID=2307007 RepID=UPI002B472BAE|nr:copper chaperone PCu(A)C [Aromatoleum sp.]HJV24255.1 copper chaperone PCu(A)C [Aromatoleum sp.]
MKNLSAAALLSLAVALPALADVKIEEAWVRATVPQQKVTGAFMRITASQDSRLVAIQSPVSDKVEIHEMVQEADVMKMRAVASLPLPAGKALELKPGGYHAMLFDLKRALPEGESVPLKLTVEGKDGRRETIEINAPVRPLHAMGGGHVH